MALSLKKSEADTIQSANSDDVVDKKKADWTTKTKTTTTTTTTTVNEPACKGQSTSSNSHGARRRSFHDWFHWHEPGTSTEEKKLIFKIDWFLLSFSCLSFFIKQLDQNNVSNAYVSGMKEDLGFGPGNELSWMNTYFNIGTIIGGPVSNLVLTAIRPRYWLPGCLLVWSFFVLFSYKAETASQMYGLRFSIGFFESASWPGIQYVLGCWYRKSEMARRSGLFVMSGVLGQMFSGYLQAALYKGMNGRLGLASWRWLFIFDFLLALPVVLYGLIFLPDTPETTRAFYLNDWERERACQRIREEGRTPAGRFDSSIFKRILLSWQLYAFAIAYSLWTLTCGSYVIQWFGIWLKGQGKYSVPQINNIPTTVGAINWFFMMATGYVADKLGRRGPVCFAVGCLLIFCYAVHNVSDASNKLRMAAFVLTGCYGCYTPLLAGWLNTVCGGDEHLRAFSMAFMVSVGMAVVIPWQQLAMPSGQAPEFTKTHGWIGALVFAVVLALWTGFGIDLMQKICESKTRKKVDGDDETV